MRESSGLSTSACECEGAGPRGGGPWGPQRPQGAGGTGRARRRPRPTPDAPAAPAGLAPSPAFLPGCQRPRRPLGRPVSPRLSAGRHAKGGVSAARPARPRGGGPTLRGGCPPEARDLTAPPNRGPAREARANSRHQGQPPCRAAPGREGDRARSAQTPLAERTGPAAHSGSVWSSRPSLLLWGPALGLGRGRGAGPFTASHSHHVEVARDRKQRRKRKSQHWGTSWPCAAGSPTRCREEGPVRGRAPVLSCPVQLHATPPAGPWAATLQLSTGRARGGREGPRLPGCADRPGAGDGGVGGFPGVGEVGER